MKVNPISASDTRAMMILAGILFAVFLLATAALVAIYEHGAISRWGSAVMVADMGVNMIGLLAWVVFRQRRNSNTNAA